MRESATNLLQTLSAAKHLANVGRPRQPLFLLSHTRSYSSLLCHILNSNAAIDGYGELWIDYRSTLDLFALRHKIVVTTGRPLQGRYTLDKLLHNKLDVCDDVLLSPGTRVMIGIREPEGTVRSNVEAGRAPNAPQWKRTPEAATNHYVKRLEALVKIAERRADVVAYPMDALVNDTDTFLAGLTDWLDLDIPLTSTYDVGPKTGTPVFGDTSDNIRAGSVRPIRQKHEVEIPDRQLDQLWTAYDRAMTRLTRLCDVSLCAGSIVERPSSPSGVVP